MFGSISLLSYGGKEKDTRQKDTKGMSWSNRAIFGNDVVQILSLDSDLSFGDRSDSSVDEMVSRSFYDWITIAGL